MTSGSRDQAAVVTRRTNGHQRLFSPTTTRCSLQLSAQLCLPCPHLFHVALQRCSHCCSSVVRVHGMSARDGAPNHTLKRCPACQRVWDRDVNAALNILRIVLSEHGGGARPPDLCRRQQQQQQQEEEDDPLGRDDDDGGGRDSSMDGAAGEDSPDSASSTSSMDVG